MIVITINIISITLLLSLLLPSSRVCRGLQWHNIYAKFGENRPIDLEIEVRHTQNGDP
jgi:hypothetical protein